MRSLAEFIEPRRHIPFTWGKLDCCMLAADWVEAQTGTDFAAEFRGRYSTRIGATRALKKAGFDDVEAAVTAALGEPVGRLQLRRGDLALVSQFAGPALGIVGGDLVWAPGNYGLVTVKLGAALKGWRLPCRQ
ncbi:DUF6950 family protein [Gallaecimonas xiamenensis]|uniref:DUF6950 domain-containing protein n=1 Tax=Gallaecimonas xiamenensis 3-C-1 TaxID=745411 RepID=K2IXN9_9GAMM|nr:hypothetical protein [Gallaecimonas xiamenensis]EKE75181.1 hypothetical protein B3C1_07891 [Gallaecimonas xiamenensis 3-C-1]